MTALGRRAMAGPDFSAGEGERREARMRRRRYLAIGTLFVVGMVSGFYVGFNEAQALFRGGEGAWSPALSLILVAMFVIAMIGGTYILNGVMDEHERERTYKAASFGGAALLTLYPIWFLLWKGGFLPEPSHLVMYLGFLAAVLLATGWYRFR